MREAFVGFDSAWAGKTPGGMVWASFVDGEAARFALPQSVDFSKAAQIIKKLGHEHDYVLVALDQPTVVPNETGSRPVDRIAGSLISRLKGGVQPANRGKSLLFGPDAPVSRFRDRIDPRGDPVAARRVEEGVHLIEVFPALALPALEPRIHARGDAARYNPAKRKKFRIADWRLVAKAVERHAEGFDLPPLAEWAAEASKWDKPGKADQDKLDAAICLVVALHWRRSSAANVAVIGDEQEGHMVTVVSAETGSVLRRASRKAGAPFEQPSLSAAAPRTHAARTDRAVLTSRTLSTESGTTGSPPIARPARSAVFNAAELRGLLIGTARCGGLLTYGEVVSTLLGESWSAQARTALFKALDCVAAENQRRGEPLLPALVVSEAKRVPGPGFFAKWLPGVKDDPSRREAHEECLAAVRRRWS